MAVTSRVNRDYLLLRSKYHDTEGSSQYLTKITTTESKCKII